MSLREKAREVKAAGEEARGDFTPTGAPKRLYKYWLNNANRKTTYDLRNGIKKENFCHFWRVVIFWAPWLAFRNAFVTAVEALVDNKYVMGALGVVMVVGLILAGITWGEFGSLLVYLLITCYTVVGLIVGGLYAEEKFKVEKWAPDTYYHETEANRPCLDEELRLISWLTIPVSWFTYSMVAIGVRMDRDTKELIVKTLLSLLAVGGVVGLLVAGFVAFGWWTLVIIGVGAAAVALLFGFGIGLGYLFESLRAYNRNKPAKPAPTYDELVEVKAPKAKREPGRLSKFFTGVADFLILAAQVVRVNKWKICPIVTIDDAVDTK